MRVVSNLGGTTSPDFKIGKSGITIYQGTTDPSLTNSMNTGDLFLNKSSGVLSVWQGLWKLPKMDNLSVSGSTMSSDSGNNIVLEPAAGKNIMLSGLKWPATDGSSNQVLTTDGAGTLKWESLQKTTQILYGNFSVSSGTSSIPADNTTPLISEGTQVWSQTITPSLQSSLIELTLSCQIGNSNHDTVVTLALFRGSTCIAVKSVFSNLVGVSLATLTLSTPVHFSLIDPPATTSTVTYSLRAGVTGGTWYFGQTASATYNGMTAGNYVLKEIN